MTTTTISFTLLSLFVFCESADFGRSLFGGYAAGVSGGGYGGISGGGGGGSVGAVGGYGGPITAAVESHRTFEVRPLNIVNEPPQHQVIEVPSEDLPVTVHFKSQSSRVHVQQTHIPGVPSEVEHTSSEDEPHRVVHEVVKPVIQEVREVIQPYRRLIQQIQPVIEQTHTIVAKGEPRLNAQQIGGQQQYSSAKSSYGGSSYGGGSLGGGGGGLSSYGGGGYSSQAAASGARIRIIDPSSLGSSSGISGLSSSGISYKSKAAKAARA